MTFGQRALGVSDSLLMQQRRASAACTCVTNAGANLDLTLMISDGKSKGASDPAFEAHIGVVHHWALAVWESWAPRVMLDYVLRDARSRLSKARSVWSVVYGPAAALLATLWRLQWEAVDAENIKALLEAK